MNVDTKQLQGVCDKCKSNLSEQVHRPDNQIVGSVGLHIKRVMCACGCKSVSFFHVLNRGLMAPRRTTSLAYLPMNQYELEQYNAVFGKVYGFASA